MRKLSSLENGTYHGYRTSLKIVRHGRSSYNERTLDGPRAVYEFLREIGTYDREVFYRIDLSGKNIVVGCEEVSRGTLSSTLVHPREVFKGALLSNASSILVCHNHPSADPTPSPEDLALTERLYRSGKLLGIELTDSVIIADGRYHSLRESGAFERFGAGTKGLYDE